MEPTTNQIHLNMILMFHCGNNEQFSNNLHDLKLMLKSPRGHPPLTRCTRGLLTYQNIMTRRKL